MSIHRRKWFGLSGAAVLSLGGRKKRLLRSRLQFEPLEDRRVLAAGDLDSSFGTGGLVTTEFVGEEDQITDIAIQADGKIVAFGVTLEGGGSDFGLARYYTDGSLDLTFGGDGKVSTDIDGHEGPNQLAIASDGKIVAVGTTAGGGYVAVVRYNDNGAPDSSFGINGVVKIDVAPGAGAGFENAVGVAIDGNGRIVVVGQVWNGAHDNSDIFVLRLSATNGELDPSFAADGIATTDIITAGVQSLHGRSVGSLRL